MPPAPPGTNHRTRRRGRNGLRVRRDRGGVGSDGGEADASTDEADLHAEVGGDVVQEFLLALRAVGKVGDAPTFEFGGGKVGEGRGGGGVGGGRRRGQIGRRGEEHGGGRRGVDAARQTEGLLNRVAETGKPAADAVG